MRRWLLFALAMLPVAALVLLLTWGLLRTGGNPGGLAVNESPGEEPIAPSVAPAFEVATLRGGPVLTNEDLLGKYVLIDFWSSWCPPCRSEAAGLAEVYREYATEDVEFLGIAIWDQARDVLAHIDRYRVHYPNALDDRGEMAIDFGVRGVPEKYFIDPQGIIVRQFNGPLSPEQLREVLDELLAGSS